MKAGHRGVTAAVLALVGLTSCTPDTGDQAGSKMPPITRPLDASAYAAEKTICRLFTDQDARAYGYQDQGQEWSSTASSPACVWGKPNFMEVSILKTDFLRDLYGGSSMESTTVVGRPAAKMLGNPAGKAPIDEHCRVLVALTEHQSLDISVNLGDGAHGACDQAVDIATEVLHKLGA